MKRQYVPINRDNYEIWFIDYMDGQFSEAENELFQNFLLENPDLSVELNNLTEVTLPAPESISFPDKALLKKAPEPFSEFCEYDFQMVKAFEEGRSAPDYVNLSSPLAQKDWTLYQKSRLQAETIVYPHKTKLKHRRFAFRPAVLRTIAAAILLLILFNVREDVQNYDFDDSQMVTVTELMPPIEPTPVLTQTDSVTHMAIEKVIVPDRLAKIHEAPTKEVKTGRALKLIKEIPTPLAAPKAASLTTPSLPDSYEIGLKLMLPKYVENHQLMASQSGQSTPHVAKTDTKTFLKRTTDLIQKIPPFNLTYNKVYNDEGELVALNLSGENFEVAQRVPKWLNVK